VRYGGMQYSGYRRRTGGQKVGMEWWGGGMRPGMGCIYMIHHGSFFMRFERSLKMRSK
jgi:hypothetical protein